MKKATSLHSALALSSALALALGMALVGAPARPAAAAPALVPRVEYVGSITQDEEGGPLYFPFSIYVDRGRDEAYVIDGKGRVIIYSANFFPLVTIAKASGIVSPASAAVDKAGNVYVAQAPGKGVATGRISVLDACLKPVRQINFSGFPGAEAFSPHRIALRPDGCLCVVGSPLSGIVVIQPDGTQRVVNPAAKDTEAESKPNFSDVSLDEAGNLYAVSEELGRVYVLDKDFKEIRHFGVKGGSAGKLSRPQGVAADANRGLDYVVDYMRHAVSIYGSDGSYVGEFGGLGLGPGWFQFPKDVGVDSKGRVFVVDTFNQRVQVFKVEWQPPPAQEGRGELLVPTPASPVSLPEGLQQPEETQPEQ